MGNAVQKADSAKPPASLATMQAFYTQTAELTERIWAEGRQTVLDAFERGIQEHHFVVLYQPIYDATDATPCASEALVRWQDPHFGHVLPSEFVPVLEETRLVDELDAYVLKQVCEDWRTAREAGLTSLPVSLNFSRHDFTAIDVAGMVQEAAHEAGMPPSHLRVEVTETTDAVTDERLAEQIARLREAGFEVWMDDFGAGMSSLAELDLLTFDVVKLDMAFMRNFGRPNTRLILTSVVGLLKQLGRRVLAEGVESEEQYLFMRSIGCDYIQGYYFGKPMPFDELCTLVQKALPL